MSNIKQVIVMRTDLGMRKGKMIAQGAHAAMQCLVVQDEPLEERWFGDADYFIVFDKTVMKWLTSGMTKICVKADNEDHLLSIYDRAVELGITAHLVRDAGHTEIPAGTITSAAIGPDLSERVDLVTGSLKLL